MRLSFGLGGPRLGVGLIGTVILGLLVGTFIAAWALIAVIFIALALLVIGIRGCIERYGRGRIGDAGRRQAPEDDAE